MFKRQEVSIWNIITVCLLLKSRVLQVLTYKLILSADLFSRGIVKYMGEMRIRPLLQLSKVIVLGIVK